LERLEAGQKNIEGFFAVTSNGEASLKQAKRSRSSSPVIIDTAAKKPRAMDAADGASSASPAPEANIWKCPRCKHQLPAPDTSEDSAAAVFSEQKQEHADYHYAKDLQEGRDPDAEVAKSTQKKKKKKPEGIKAFFGPKK
jgi:hypothetical protein